MGLELVFVCSRTLGKLRSDPLGELLDGYCDWLLEWGFCRSTIRIHLSNVSHLNRYLDGQKIACGQILSAKDISGFLKEYPLQARPRKLSENQLKYRGQTRMALTYTFSDAHFPYLLPCFFLKSH